MINPTLFIFVAILGVRSLGDFRTAFAVVSINKANAKNELMIRVDSDTSISVLKSDGKQLVLRQVAKNDERPYIHPIYSPDGRTVITEFRPGHHLHQTGLFWGLKRVNERDYFMNGRSNYWKRVSMKVIKDSGKKVSWQTTYMLLDSIGGSVMKEEQNWTVEENDGKFIFDFEWKGTALIDVHIGKFYVGGLFVRMPWRKGTPATATNASGLINKQAESQRSEWLDVGIQFKDPTNQIHFSVLDHPSNKAFPTPFRIDGEFGFGPSRQIMEDWKIPRSETETIRYRMIIYSGDLDQQQILRESQKYQIQSKF